jgi:hypothetical protein
MTVGVEEERRGRAGAVDGAKEMDDDDEVWVEPTANEVTVLLVVGTLLRWGLARLAAEGGARAGATDDGAPECTPLMRDITIGGPLPTLVLPALSNTRTTREDQAHEGVCFGAQGRRTCQQEVPRA